MVCRLMWLFCALAAAQEHEVPVLGAAVPAPLEKSPSRSCATGAGHQDPCTSTKIGGAQFTIAWDARSKAITYLFTEDSGLVMDSELGVGGLCALGERTATTRYLDWLVTPAWSATARKLSGDAIWYALLRPSKERAGYGVIAGFVQSRYLMLR